MSGHSTICFCLDAGASLGWGHAMRCHTLAQEFQKAGIRTELITTSQDFEWSTHFPLFENPSIINDWGQSSLQPNRIGILDHKELVADYRFLERWLTCFEKAIVIDDEINPIPESLDLVINPNVYAKEGNYPANASLTGPEYTILRAGFSTPQTIPELAGIPAPYLPIILGGNDAHNLQDTLIEYLAPHTRELPPVIIVNAKKESSIPSIHGICRSLDASELAYLFKHSAFAITSLGGTANELAYCETPFIGICLNQNQRNLSDFAAEYWQMPAIDIQDLNETSLINATRTISDSAYPKAPQSMPHLGGKTNIVRQIQKILK